MLSAFGIASLLIFLISIRALIYHYQLMRKRGAVDHSLTQIEELIYIRQDILMDIDESDLAANTAAIESAMHLCNDAIQQYNAYVTKFPARLIAFAAGLSKEKALYADKILRQSQPAGLSPPSQLSEEAQPMTHSPSYKIRPIRFDNAEEIETAAALIAEGYFGDTFFQWVIDNPDDHHRIITEYYKIYLQAGGCIAHVAELVNVQAGGEAGKIVGATVWLPHDVDAGIYADIEKTAGAYAPQFHAVADKSHANEPHDTAFYQLVGFVVDSTMRGQGIGVSLLKFHLDAMDRLGIPTYLEASTPFYGGGVYGKFGYALYGELMVFAEGVVLYPLFRACAGAVGTSEGTGITPAKT